MIFKLFFQNSRDERKFITDFDDMEQAFALIHADLKTRAPNFKSYYTRSWQENSKEIYYDVGSHTEFYVVVKE